MSTPPNVRVQGVEYEKVSDEYFQQRQQKRGAAGSVLLVGLGVAYVISGDFAGWNSVSATAGGADSLSPRC